MNITPKPCINYISLSVDIYPSKNSKGIISKTSKTTSNIYKFSKIHKILSRNVAIVYEGSIFKRIFKKVVTYIERNFDMSIMTFKKSSVIRNRR